MSDWTALPTFPHLCAGPGCAICRWQVEGRKFIGKPEAKPLDSGDEEAHDKRVDQTRKKSDRL